MRYLVRQNVTFSKDDLDHFVDGIDDKDFWAGLSMLGDVLAANEYHSDAILVYDAAINDYEGLEEQGDHQLSLCKTCFTLGSVYVKAGAATDVDTAKALFWRVLATSIICRNQRNLLVFFTLSFTLLSFL